MNYGDYKGSKFAQNGIKSFVRKDSSQDIIRFLKYLEIHA